MKRRAFLYALGAVACTSRAPQAKLCQAALAVARKAGQLPAADERFSWDELGRIRLLAEAALGRAASGDAGRVLSELLFERLGFVREVDDTSLSFVLLPSVLRERRGSCVGLGVLFLALAEAVGQRANGVLMPGHFYVRLASAHVSRNVELLRRGEAMPDAWYEKRFPIPGTATREYARPLTSRETLGVMEYDVGNERRRQLRLEEARSAYERATRAFPDLAEAHASLGATLHLLGRLAEAAQSYERARTVNPYLPGVAWNRALLADEVGAESTPQKSAPMGEFLKP